MLSQLKEQIGEHETKFVLPNYRAHIIVAWLKRRCLPDPDYAEGKVSSIYFDTRDWVYLAEKINSDYLKTKVRLRWYSNAVTDSLFPSTFLEVKSKIGSARKKIRLLLDIDSERIVKTPLNDPQFIEIPQSIKSEDIYLERPLFPTFQLNYHRFRFIDPMTDSRLCVDCNIHVSRVNPIMVNRMNPEKLKEAVFELKEKSCELPDWLHQLTSLGCRRDAFSKYSSCYAQLERIIF